MVNKSAGYEKKRRRNRRCRRWTVRCSSNSRNSMTKKARKKKKKKHKTKVNTDCSVNFSVFVDSFFFFRQLILQQWRKQNKKQKLWEGDKQVVKSIETCYYFLLPLVFNIILLVPHPFPALLLPTFSLSPSVTTSSGCWYCHLLSHLVRFFIRVFFSSSFELLLPSS